MEFALHDLGDQLPIGGECQASIVLRQWAADPEIVALGEWR